MAELRDALRRSVEIRAEGGWTGADYARQALAALDDGDLDPDLDPDLDAALATLTARFGLDPADAALFAVAAAAEQNVGLHLLSGLLSGDDGPARPTVAIALELAGLPVDGRHAHARFGAAGRLVDDGLLELAGDDVLLSRRLVLPPRVAAVLAGDPTPAPAVRTLLREVEPVTVDGTAAVAAALGSGARLVWILDPRGGPGTAMAAAACEAAGLPCLVADLALAGNLPDGTGVEAAVDAVLLEAALNGCVLVLAGAERVAARALTDAVVPVLAVSHEPWDPRAGSLPLTVTAPPLSVAQRRALWRPLLDDDAAASEVSGMPLRPDQIATVADHARRTAAVHGEATVSVERVRDSARQLSRGKAVRANAGSAVSLDDLMLPDAAVAEFTRLIDWARYRDQVAAMGALYGKGGKGTGICALFSGPPGTGKTLAAHVIADTLGMDLYQVDLSTIVDKYIGETEKNLEKAFAEAEATNAVLFFDEADALFGSRSEVKDSKDRYANQEIAYLLQRVERFDGIVVLASNLRGNIDSAFARRLHFMITFPDPDEPTRARLWRLHLAGVPSAADDPVDIDRLAKAVELAGGNIRNMVLSAVHDAVAEGGEVGMRHVVAAARREYVKIGRIPPSSL